MIEWPKLNGKPVGLVLRDTTWESIPGIIADNTRSGKLKTRANHIKSPDEFKVVMHMTLPEYRVFDLWWRTICRKGAHTFGYPKINDNNRAIIEYQFVPESRIEKSNTSGDNLEITMQWMEAT